MWLRIATTQAWAEPARPCTDGSAPPAPAPARRLSTQPAAGRPHADQSLPAPIAGESYHPHVADHNGGDVLLLVPLPITEPESVGLDQQRRASAYSAGQAGTAITA